MKKSGAISDLLLRAALVDSVGLERALEIQSKSGGSLGKILTDLGLADENVVCAAIAWELRLECVGPNLPEVLPETAQLLPIEFCRKRLVVPLSLNSKSLRLAMVDPVDYFTIQDVMFRTSKEVLSVVAKSSFTAAHETSEGNSRREM